MTFRHVNRSARRVDARDKVTGRARFGADLSFAGMLSGAVLRARYPHARICKIDTGKAEKISGVRAILTAEDIPQNRFGVIIPDQQVLAERENLFIGDGIALVAADDRETAARAAEAIQVEYQELPGIFDPAEARRSGVDSVHQELADNQVAHHPLRKGDPEKGFQEADIILESEYTTQFIEHAYLEPEVVIAVPHERNSLITIYGSVQNPYACRNAVATVLQVPLTRVRIVQSNMGGSFGGKDEVISCMAARAALLALAAERPVRLCNTREESLLESYKRHPYRMKYRVGATRDGRLTAMEIEAIADSGAYACQTPFVTWRSVVQATGPYKVPNVRTDTYGYYTNNIYTGAMRGYGAPQVLFGYESLLDELAAALGMNPLEIRLKNMYEQGSETASGQKLDSHQVSLQEVMEKAVAASNYRKKYELYSRPQQGDKRKGIGLAISFRGCSLGAEAVDAAGAIISIQKDGQVFIYSGLAENGQGLKTVFSQIAAEVLGISAERITHMDVDTSIAPDSGSTVASRSTLVGGNAVKDAAEKLKDTITRLVIEMGDGDGNKLLFKDDRIYSATGKLLYTFEEATSLAYSRGCLLSALGWYKAPDISWDEETGQGNPYFTYVYGCQIAEVEVDIGTGEVQVQQMTAAHEAGRAINPASVKGQIYGGTAMGLGYALLEKVEVAEGYVISTNFDSYLIPTVWDVPEIRPIIVENPDPAGPYGAKSVGEPTLDPGAAAIANAVAQATGRRIRNLPLNLERVLLGRTLTKGSEAK
ncbi:MAG: xanthine dehydrogenase family protein molybdopterin-binding subunit [Halanaerobium sp.]|nr:xanthine dehydrogenase family protein molybdopterin-binding subunit [Halanaerobium sp.]